MGFLAKVVLNLLRSLFLFNRLTEKNTDPCTKAIRYRIVRHIDSDGVLIK